MNSLIAKTFAKGPMLSSSSRHPHTSQPGSVTMKIVYCTSQTLKFAKVGKRALVPPSNFPMNEFAKIVEVDSYFITKSILLFFMFYGSMNWWHYRSLRKADDEEDKPANKK